MKPEKETNSCLCSLLDVLPDPFAYHQIMIGSDNNPEEIIFVDINPAFAELVKMPKEKIIGSKAVDIYPAIAGDILTWLYTSGKTALSGETIRTEHYFKPLDSWYEIIAYSDKQGYFAILFRGSSEKKKIEMLLDRKFKEYETVFQGTQSAMFLVEVIDEHTFRYVRNNRGQQQLTGFSQEDFLGKTPRDLMGAEQGERTAGRYSQCLHTGAPITYEETLYLPGGKRIWYTTLTPFYGEKHKITHIIGSGEDITERRLAEEKIRYLSFHDSLTGFYNRNYLEEEMQRLNTERQLPLSIIMVDLNGLKLVNDTYGHHNGDKLLQYASYILRTSCRDEDVITRWGGDEFVIILPQTDEREVTTIVRRIKDNCRDAYVESIPLSMALGFSTNHSSATGPEEILKEAEDDMYKQKLAESKSAKSAVLNALIKTLGTKSYETEKHTREMQKIAGSIGKKINLPDSELTRLAILITLHDIGKINLPEEMLTKDGPLTKDEWQLMKGHPEIGYRITLATEEFSHVSKEILSHHERWDGSGYPQGLEKEKIPLLARITAIADAFEVMSNGRPYKKELPLEEIVTEFKKCSGTQFDPVLTDTFLSVMEKGQNRKKH